MSNQIRGNETVWHIQQRLRERGYDISPDGLLPLSATAWDNSETLQAMLADLGGPVETAPDAPRSASGADRPKVYLEVGHGPKGGRYDPGAVHASSQTTEHKLNELGADACADALRKAGCHVTIGDHRESNYRAGQRAKGYDILISFHHNAAGGKAQGAECLYDPRGHTADDAKLARMISAEMAVALGISDRGAKERRLSVLSGARSVGVPTAVLAELYFIHQQSPDNPPASLMPSWSRWAGEAIARAVLEYSA